MQITARSVLRVLLTALVLAGLTFGVASSARAATTPEQVAMNAWKIQTVDVPMRDVAYVSQRDVLVAAVAQDHASLGNELLEVSPHTGTILRHLFVGSSPSRVAVSDDGSTAYVALEGANAIVRVNLLTFTIAQRFSTGADRYFGPVFGHDIDVAPGRNDVVVASLEYRGLSPQQFGTWAFKDGVALPVHTSTYPDFGPQEVVFADATTLYGSDAANFYRLTLADDGVTMAKPHDILSGQHLKMAGDLIATSSGRLLDPTGPTTVRNLGVEGRFAPQPSLDRITFAASVWPDPVTISQYRLSDGALLASRQFPTVSASRELTEAGTGFALATASSLVLLGPTVLPGDVVIPPGPLSTVQSLGERLVPVHARHIVYDPLLNRIYATVGDDKSLYANTVVAIDPVLGTVVGIAPVGFDPDALALSDDSSTLYVGLKGLSAVTIVNALLMLPLGVIPLDDVDGHHVFAQDVAVRPGASDTVAVTLRWDYQSGEAGLILFKDGRPRPNALMRNNSSPPAHLAFASSTKLYGASGGTIHEIDVNDDGVSQAKSTYAFFYGLGVVDGTTAWTGNGYSFDPSSPDELFGWLAMEGRVDVQPARNRVFSIGNSTPSLVEFDMVHFRPIGSRRTVNAGYPGELVHTDTGLAVRAEQGVMLLDPVYCEGMLATLTTSGGTATGTPGDDVIVGGVGADTIDGGGGNDLICGMGGNDVIEGGTGNDRIFAAEGNDTLNGGDGNDVLRGGTGNDRLRGGAGADDVYGGAGTDVVYLGGGTVPTYVDLDNVADDGAAGERDNVRTSNEFIVGTFGPDTIIGSSGNEVLLGGAGNDTLYGLSGNDNLGGGDGDDALYGGPGLDTCAGGNGEDSTSTCERVS